MSFSGGDQIGGGIEDGLVVALDLRVVFGLVAILAAGGGIEDGNDETFGFGLGRKGGGKCNFHGFLSLPDQCISPGIGADSGVPPSPSARKILIPLSCRKNSVRKILSA